MTGALQSIIFDFDGVIADSEPLHFRAFQHTLAQEGIELRSAEYYARYLGYDDVGLFQALATDRGLPMDASRMSALLAAKGQRLQEMLERGHVLFPGAADFVRSAAAEVPIAIASGALRREIVEITNAAGIGNLFAVIVAAGDTPESKPSPAPYLLAFEQLQLHTGNDMDPRRTVAIEDSQWGLESARGAGLRCVGVTNSYDSSRLPGAELVATGLDALTLPALHHLCATDPQPIAGAPHA
ncbi:MAG: HAD family phosphatase [Acidobacteria bacterium]|nr:HAD family phosphatase [Acidobacteriota bacterium]